MFAATDRTALAAVDSFGSMIHCSRSKVLLFLLPIIFFAWSCAGTFKPRERQGEGGKYYGGVFNANETEGLRSLFPLSITQASSARVASQIYEGLVGFHPSDLTIRPALASSWTVDQTSTVFTFTIRKNVRFHDDACFQDGKGRSLTARDVAACFTRICTAAPSNQMQWLFLGRIVGADDHYNATEQGIPSAGVKGIEVLDEQTLRISLTASSPTFLHILAHQGCWIYPEEMVKHYSDDILWHPVGTGPFQLKSYRRGESLVLERNPYYWAADELGNPLPFLDAIRYTFAADKNRELDEFLKGNLSMIFELPVGRTDVLKNTSGFQLQTIPAFSVQYYGFNARRAPFMDGRVRRAFSMAIDRQMIVDSILHGLAVPAKRGMVPPGFKDYPYDLVPELRHDPEEARRLLASAGFPGGKGMATVFMQVNNDGFGYVEVASLIQSMLEKELGVRVVSSVLPMEQHFEKIEQGSASFWRAGWIVDHPDPENILEMFHGRTVPADTAAPSYLNNTRYKDQEFDTFFDLAHQTTDPRKRAELLAKAEKVLMEDMIVMPIYHENSVRLLQPYVKDMFINAMEFRDMRMVWFDPTLREDI
jgi:peptide/nickel transport system substrate-binding protein